MDLRIKLLFKKILSPLSFAIFFAAFQLFIATMSYLSPPANDGDIQVVSNALSNLNENIKSNSNHLTDLNQTDIRNLLNSIKDFDKKLPLKKAAESNEK
jgi:hypothetical protein